MYLMAWHNKTSIESIINFPIPIDSEKYQSRILYSYYYEFKDFTGNVSNYTVA